MAQLDNYKYNKNLGSVNVYLKLLILNLDKL